MFDIFSKNFKINKIFVICLKIFSKFLKILSDF